MNDDLNRKVQQIAQLLGHDDVPDNVKELVSLLSASLEKSGDKSGDSSSKVDVSADPAQPVTPKQNIPESTPAQTTAAQHDTEESPQMNQDVLNTARSALSRLNTVNDPRINLLNAIKPFMNNRRQKKISNCIQLLQIASLSRLLNEQEKQTR